jgi:hypothetical protein
MYKSILVISDTHVPYHHKDLFPFLKEVKKQLNPDKVVHIGDELDKHALSFHDNDPDLPSAGDELRISLPIIKEMEKLFPHVDLLDSNHGSLVYRRSLKYGIPKAYLKHYNDFLQVGKGWQWHDDLILTTPLGPVYFCHGKIADVLTLAQSMGMSCVQGHYHSSFNIKYYGNSLGLYYGLQVGCLIDKDSLAFRYNKTQRARPIIGCAGIIQGLPKLIPMVLDKHGRWIGKIYS